MSERRLYKNIALIGFMGTGKSTVGRQTAHTLHFNFADTDELIENLAQKPIARIFAEDGEPAFREFEARAVKDLAQRERTVIATGGGVGGNPAHLASLKAHALVVCLWATADTIHERVKLQTHRPLLLVPDPLARIRELLAQREPVYRQADVLVNTGLRTLKEVVAQVVHHFRAAQALPGARNQGGLTSL